MSLPGVVVEKLVEALLSAFPNPAELAYFVRVRLNESLEAVADPGNLKLRVFSLIVALDAAGEARIRALVLAMRRERANNPKVREALELSAFCWVSALPSPESVQTLVDLLRDQTVSREDIFASYAVVADDPRRPETIADAVWRVAETSAKTGLPRLVRFVHHVAVRADAGSGRQALLDWIGRYVDQHALDRKQVAAIAEH